jgi:hypothetical protein
MTFIRFFRFFNEIKRSYSKRCVDCKYYLTSTIINENNRNYFATAKCRKFLSETTDGMGPEFEYAYITRSEKSMCGPQGTYFKPFNKTK